MKKLHNKSVIITGGGRGIGRAAAIAFADEGAKVGVSARTQTEIDDVVNAITSTGGNAIAIPCDVSDSQAVQSMLDEAAAKLGGVDVLVNNAGGGFRRSAVADSRPEDWAAVIEVNLLGAYYCSRAALPYLTASRNGKIINVGSGMGHTARGGNSAYHVAKAGLWMFTRCLAHEVWKDGVDVNEFIPGPVYTDLTSDVFDPTGEKPPAFADSERVKTPDECIPMLMFLASHPPGGPTAQSFSLARRPL